MNSDDSQRRLEEIFGKFPGIGPRQARRFVYHLLNKSPSAIKELIDLIADVKKSTSECEKCHRFFTHGHSKASVCPTCADSARDQATLMVVARDSDFESVERSGAYRGLYFILGGTVPILDKEPEKRIRLKSLLERVSGTGAASPFKGFSEIILSLNTTPDGEHTEKIVKEAVERLMASSAGNSDGRSTGTDALYPSKVTVLGRGLSTGAELEYADSETIKNAFDNRKQG